MLKHFFITATLTASAAFIGWNADTAIDAMQRVRASGVVFSVIDPKAATLGCIDGTMRTGEASLYCKAAYQAWAARDGEAVARAGLLRNTFTKALAHVADDR